MIVRIQIQTFFKCFCGCIAHHLGEMKWCGLVNLSTLVAVYLPLYLSNIVILEFSLQGTTKQWVSWFCMARCPMEWSKNLQITHPGHWAMQNELTLGLFSCNNFQTTQVQHVFNWWIKLTWEMILILLHFNSAPPREKLKPVCHNVWSRYLLIVFIMIKKMIINLLWSNEITRYTSVQYNFL